MLSINFTVEVQDDITRERLPGLTVQLYYTGVVITDGVISGQQAIPVTGDNIGTVIAKDLGQGLYMFTNISPDTYYDIVISGPGVLTQILSQYQNFNPLPIAKGYQISSGETDTRSIKKVLNQIITFVNTQSAGITLVDG